MNQITSVELRVKNYELRVDLMAIILLRPTDTSSKGGHLP